MLFHIALRAKGRDQLDILALLRIVFKCKLAHDAQMKAPFFHTVQPVAGTAHECDRTRDPFLVQFLIQSAGQAFIAQAIRHRHHAGQTRIAAILRHCHIVDLCCNGAVLPMGFQTDHMILFQVVQRDLDISPCHLALFAQFRHRGDPVSRFQPCQDLRDLQRCQTRLLEQTCVHHGCSSLLDLSFNPHQVDRGKFHRKEAYFGRSAPPHKRQIACRFMIIQNFIYYNMKSCTNFFRRICTT